jgi:hypothetical protein
MVGASLIAAVLVGWITSVPLRAVRVSSPRASGVPWVLGGTCLVVLAGGVAYANLTSPIIAVEGIVDQLRERRIDAGPFYELELVHPITQQRHGLDIAEPAYRHLKAGDPVAVVYRASDRTVLRLAITHGERGGWLWEEPRWLVLATDILALAAMGIVGFLGVAGGLRMLWSPSRTPQGQPRYDPGRAPREERDEGCM